MADWQEKAKAFDEKTQKFADSLQKAGQQATQIGCGLLMLFVGIPMAIWFIFALLAAL